LCCREAVRYGVEVDREKGRIIRLAVPETKNWEVLGEKKGTGRARASSKNSTGPRGCDVRVKKSGRRGITRKGELNGKIGQAGVVGGEQQQNKKGGYRRRDQSRPD